MIPDDFELMAYVDGELDPQTSKRVAEAVEADPALREKVEALIASRELARAAYSPAEAAPLSPALDDMMKDLGEALAQPDIAPDWQSAGARVSGLTGFMAWARPVPAAMVAIGIAAGALMTWAVLQQTQPRPFLSVSQSSGTILSAQAQQALNSTPTNEVAYGADMVATFITDAGETCRQFELADQVGIACRDQESWHLVVLAAQPDQDQFRPAGATEPLAAFTAQLGVQKVLSESEEAALIASSWRPTSNQSD